MNIKNNMGFSVLEFILIAMAISIVMRSCEVEVSTKEDKEIDNSIYNMECINIKENFQRCSNEYTSCYRYSDINNLNNTFLMDCGSKNGSLSELKDLEMSCTDVKEDFKRCQNNERTCYIYSNSNELNSETLMDCL